jgi:hypothetical protein
MPLWFMPRKATPSPSAPPTQTRLAIPEGPDIDVRVGVDVSCTPAEVWALVRPAEKAWIVDPDVDRCFKAPGTPDGVGEIQVFISVPHAVTGQRRVTAVEVLVEVPERYAKIRSLTEVGVSSEMEYRLSASDFGTFLEIRSTKDYTPTAGRSRSDSVRAYIDKEMKRCTQQWEDYLQRVKSVLETAAVAENAASTQRPAGS